MFNLFLTQYSGMFLGPIAKLLGWILNAIYEFLAIFGIANAGICIILFTFIVKALMIPLTIKQQKFAKVSSTMNPEITKIQAKYKGKKDEASLKNQQLETQAVYQKYGANPTSGCLPLLITLPIMLALYRVIYNIPAYVNAVYSLYENIAIPIQSTSGHLDIMRTIADASIKMDKFNIVNNTIEIPNIIDIMAKFKTTDWSLLAQKFPDFKEIITMNSDKIIHINRFFGGLNIADAPGRSFPGILIPLAAAGFQFLQGKLTPNPNGNDGNTENQAASTMKTMNTVMPIMSGFMCMALPVGVGIYWVSSSVFQIIQQLAVNKYMDQIDVNDLIAKNVEKAKKKKVKQGNVTNTTTTSMEELAKKNTKTINNSSSIDGNKISKKTNNETSDYNKSNSSYKSGSISANANLLKNRNSNNKGDN